MTNKLYSGPHAIAVTLFDQVEAKVTDWVRITDQVAAADGDRDKAIQAYKTNSEDAEAVKLRAVIEKAVAKLDELAEKNVVVVTLSDDEKAKLVVEAAGIRTNIADSIKAIEAVNKSMPLDPEGVDKALKEFQLNNPTRQKKGRAVGTANTGSNSPRTYVHIKLSGGSLTEPREFDRFSQVGSFLKIEVPELQKLFAEAAGVALDKVATVQSDTEFKVTANGLEYTVNTTPKERKTPGRKPGETSENSETPADKDAPQTGDSAE